MMQYVLMVLCLVLAIWDGFQGYVGRCLVQCGLALVNLPFALKWIKDYMNDENS